MRTYWLPASLVILCLLLQLFADNTYLRYQRESIIAGQLWRLLSGNFVHLGWAHWGMNMAGLLMAYFLIGHALRPRAGLLLILFCSLAVGVGLLAFNPSVYWYVGFSGTLHGLLAAGAIAALRASGDSQRWVYAVLLAGVTAKLAWEQLLGATPGSAELAGGPVMVDAHLYGAVGGGLFGIAAALLHRPARI